MYGICLYTMFITVFYSIIIPSCLIWGVLILIIQYFVDKYLFIRKRTIKYYLGCELDLKMVILIFYINR